METSPSVHVLTQPKHIVKEKQFGATNMWLAGRMRPRGHLLKTVALEAKILKKIYLHLYFWSMDIDQTNSE